jgi:pentatricopeptide repeat protein
MLIDGYGKQRLHEEALETFESIRTNGYRTTTVSYSSIISAMAIVEKFDKAEELYQRMVRQRVQPNLHICTTMIRCYTKRNFTRDGHKVQYNIHFVLKEVLR